MTTQIICMIQSDSELDIFESSAALFFKLAHTKKHTSVICYRFNGDNMHGWGDPSAVLKTSGMSVDDDIELYLNGHGTKQKMAGGTPGQVAKKIIEKLGLTNKTFKKIVFLACSQIRADNIVTDMKTGVLDKLEEFDIEKVVLYASVMTVFSPRNALMRQSIPAKGANKVQVHNHFERYEQWVNKFYADILNATGDEDAVYNFFTTSIAESAGPHRNFAVAAESEDKSAPDFKHKPGTAVRHHMELGLDKVAQISTALTQSIDTDANVPWGRRVLLGGTQNSPAAVFSKQIPGLTGDMPIDANIKSDTFRFLTLPDTNAGEVASENGKLVGDVQHKGTIGKVTWRRKVAAVENIVD